MTKICGRCTEEKDSTEFGKNAARRDGLATYCRPCTKTVNASYYSRTSGVHNPKRIERRREGRDEAARKLVEYLLANPCVDCGETDVMVLEFDHREPSAKSFNVAEGVTSGFSWSRVIEEIAKCDVVCANDHRRRTAKQFGWRKAILQPERR